MGVCQSTVRIPDLGQGRDRSGIHHEEKKTASVRLMVVERHFTFATRGREPLPCPDLDRETEIKSAGIRSDTLKAHQHRQGS